MEAVLVSIVTVIGIILSVVGSFVPGWFVYVDQRGHDIWIGIWFKTECSTTCITTLHKDLRSHEVQYALQVASQVLSTLANIAGIVGCVLVVLGYKSSKYSLVAKEKSTRCFIVSFALMWRIVGFFAVESDQKIKVMENIIPGITYGLILSAIGSGILFCIGIFNFISSKRKTLTPEYRLMHNTEFTEFVELFYSRSLLTVLFLISAVGFFLQLVGFVSPGWEVQSTYYSRLTHIGLWYQVDCDTDASGKCEVTSLYDIYKKRMESDKVSAIIYGLYVGNEVCATISLFAAGLAVMLGLITLVNTKRSTLLLNLIEMSCLISVLLNWPVIGEKVGYTVGRMRQDVIDGRTGTSYIFPYSAFLSAIGSTILSVVYMIHAIKYFRLLYKTQKESDTATQTNAFECNRM